MYQFIHGLHDVQMQQKIMEAAAQVEGGELSLIRVLKLAEAFKLGKASQKLVNNGRQQNRLSDYQANKRNTQKEPRSSNIKNNNAKYCRYCGRKDHTSKLSDRRDKCPAFDKVCSKCQTNGHLSEQCHGGPQSTRQQRSKSRDKKAKPSVNEVKTKDAASATTASDSQAHRLPLNSVYTEVYSRHCHRHA